MSVRQRWRGTKPIRYGIDEILKMVIPIFKSDERIRTVYIFGSRVSISQTALSDIDIAFYTAREFSWKDYFLLYSELTRVLHSDRIDLIWLNRAEPVLCFEVIKNGRLCYYRDPDMLNESELTIKKKYYDYVIYLRKHRGYRNGL